MSGGLPKDKEKNATANQVLSMSQESTPESDPDKNPQTNAAPEMVTVEGAQLKKGQKVLLGVQEHSVFEECTKKSFGSFRHAATGRFTPFSYAGKYKLIK